jgi:cell division septum initiation protein DivIVA
MSLEKILEEMENLLLDAPRVPLTNKRVVEEDDLARLIDELREEFPGEIMEATRIMQERQHILEDAQKQAQNIVDQAKGYITKLTDENIITQHAQEQANEIVLQARKAARDLQNESYNYAEDVFKYLEANL